MCFLGIHSLKDALDDAGQRLPWQLPPQPPLLQHCRPGAQLVDTVLHFATSLPDASTLSVLGTTKCIYCFFMVNSRNNKTKMSNVVMNFTLYSVGFETLLKALKQMNS